MTSTNEKYLTRLAAILNQAENASTDEESAAYMAKAQELSTAYQIDLEVARQTTVDKNRRPVPIQKTLTIGYRGQRGLKRRAELCIAIATVNDVEVNIARDGSRVYFFGFDTDIETVEILYASLLLQMAQSSDAYLKSGAYKEEIVGRWVHRRNSWGYLEEQYVEKPVDGRVARASFEEAFRYRIAARLREARLEARSKASEEQVTIDGVSSSKDLVLRNKAVEVHDFYKAHSTARGHFSGSSSSGHSRSGFAAGTAAGNSARLGASRSIGGGRTAVTA